MKTIKKKKQKAAERSHYNLPDQPKYVDVRTEIGCVIKSWRSPSAQCASTTVSRRPTLVEIDGKYSSSLDFHDYTRSSEIYNYFKLAVTGDCSPAFAYHNRDFRTYATVQLPNSTLRKSVYPPWIAVHCTAKEPNAPTQNMRFCNVVKFNHKFYAMSLQGSVAVIEEEEKGSFRLGITRVGGNRAVPSSEGARLFREYMFESGGEILVVLLVSRKSIKVVDDVEVFRLDVEKLLWEKVDKIGNKALFVEDERCMCAEACETGFKRDCVYFTHKWVDDWMVFDMKTSKILPAFD